ncbi:MAG: hypothetical protein ACJ731_03830 [Vicinamibacterales bacterium]
MPTPPADPAPVPAPVPAPPAPIPAPVWTFDGTTSEAHWFAAPALPQRFELVITNDSVEAGGHSFPILLRAADNVNVIAGTRNVETLTLEYHGPADGSGLWRWTYNGQPGQATGTLSRR